MSDILLDKATFSYLRGVFVIRQLTLEIAHHETVCLLGVSGSGKSTILHLIAGLLSLQEGELHIGGRCMDSRRDFIPPGERGVSMVFQVPALLPYRSVYSNVLFAMQKSKNSAQELIYEYLECVDMGEHRDRYPHELSLGQQQRVSLARAFASQSGIMLLDEPFSNLDPRNKAKIKEYLYSMIKKFKRTVVLVTHDPEDALLFSDRLYVMHDGQILQEGTTEALYRHPKNLFVACFFGEINRIACCLKRYRAVCQILRFPPMVEKRILQSLCASQVESLLLCIRAEDITVVSSDHPCAIFATVEELKFFGSYHWVKLRLHESITLNVKISHGVSLERFCTLYVAVNSEALMMFHEKDRGHQHDKVQRYRAPGECRDLEGVV